MYGRNLSAGKDGVAVGIYELTSRAKPVQWEANGWVGGTKKLLIGELGYGEFDFVPVRGKATEGKGVIHYFGAVVQENEAGGRQQVIGKEALLVVLGNVKERGGQDSKAGVEKGDRNKSAEDICECEAKVRAFMRMLRVKEGTSSEAGYTRLFGGDNFTKYPHNRDMSTHPRILVPYGSTNSTAAGAYQILENTFDVLQIYISKNKYNIVGFGKETQDKLCVVLLKHVYREDRNKSFYEPVFWLNKKEGLHDKVKEAKSKEWRKRFRGQQADIIQLIIDDKFEHAVLLASLCWSSLPDSPYGQQSADYTPKMVKQIYSAFLKEELLAPSGTLHLKKGFLKEFGCPCCGDSKSKVEDISLCKEDCSQCFNYEDVWENPEISSDNGGKNNNRFGFDSKRGHKGIDIVSGPKYKEVHSLMCGEVLKCVSSFKTN